MLRRCYFLACGYSVFPLQLVGDCPFPLSGLGTRVEDHFCIFSRVYFRTFYLFLGLYVFLKVSTGILITIALQYALKSGIVSSSSLLFFSKNLLAICVLLSSHMIFRMIPFYVCKTYRWDFDRDCIEYIDHIGSYWHLTINSFNPWAEMSFTYLGLFFPLSKKHLYPQWTNLLSLVKIYF